MNRSADISAEHTRVGSLCYVHCLINVRLKENNVIAAQRTRHAKTRKTNTVIFD